MLDKSIEQILYVVKYSGPFGFIKPWTAVRDGETFSQQFLTPSIIEGMRQKLEVEKILRHRLTYEGISKQQEVTQTRGLNYLRNKKAFERPRSILLRGVLINPDLYIAFSKEKDANKAYSEHICLARNEDILLPTEYLGKMSEKEFNEIPGFELRFERNDQSFLVGFNRFENAKPMYGWLFMTNQPLKGGGL